MNINSFDENPKRLSCRKFLRILIITSYIACLKATSDRCVAKAFFFVLCNMRDMFRKECVFEE